MPDSSKPAASLIMIQFLSWVADRPRSYEQTMDAWRTSCPRLSVWEDAVIEDLVRMGGVDAGNGAVNGARSVTLTKRGREMLQKARTGGEPVSSATKSKHRRRAAAESRTY